MNYDQHSAVEIANSFYVPLSPLQKHQPISTTAREAGEAYEGLNGGECQGRSTLATETNLIKETLDKAVVNVT